MVIPVLSETEWAQRLDALNEWQPKFAATVVVVPHPDDETLAAGGLIAALRRRGVPVTVVAVTDGENAYEHNEGLAETRQREQTRALAALGVARKDILRLGFTDSSVALDEEALVARLRPLIHAETQVLAPWRGDFHPDHEACARAAERVSQEAGATLISYFFWTWHRGTIATLEAVRLRRFELSGELQRVKAEALACHVSQLQHSPEPEILPEDLLWPARLPYEVYAL